MNNRPYYTRKPKSVQKVRLYLRKSSESLGLCLWLLNIWQRLRFREYGEVIKSETVLCNIHAENLFLIQPL